MRQLRNEKTPKPRQKNQKAQKVPKLPEIKSQEIKFPRQEKMRSKFRSHFRPELQELRIVAAQQHD